MLNLLVKQLEWLVNLVAVYCSVISQYEDRFKDLLVSYILIVNYLITEKFCFGGICLIFCIVRINAMPSNVPNNIRYPYH